MTQPELKYEPDGGVTHLILPSDAGRPLQESYCGLIYEVDRWRGTGSPTEYLRAASMPTCPRCARNTR